MNATARALRFHQQALEILKHCDAAVRSFRAAAARTPTVRVGVLRTVPVKAVCEVLTSLSSHAPEQRWQVREGDPAELARWLRQGRIDIAWTIVDSDAPGTQVLWREPFVILAARNHRLAQPPRRRITLKDLEGERFVLRGSCELRSGQLEAAGIKIRIAARADRDALALELIGRGFGIGVAPRSLATRDVVPLTVSDLDLSRTIGIRWRPDLAATTIAAVRAAVRSFGRPESSA